MYFLKNEPKVLYLFETSPFWIWIWQVRSLKEKTTISVQSKRARKGMKRDDRRKQRALHVFLGKEVAVKF